MSVSYYRVAQNAYSSRLVLREVAPSGTELQTFSVGSLDIEATTGEAAGSILAQWQAEQA